jgi:hypothetical protein
MKPTLCRTEKITGNVLKLMVCCGKDKLRTSLAGAVDIVRIY